MHELTLIRAGRLAWREHEAPTCGIPVMRSCGRFVAGRCDGDTLPIHRRVSRVMQVGMRARLVDPVPATSVDTFRSRGPSPLDTNASRRSSRSAPMCPGCGPGRGSPAWHGSPCRSTASTARTPGHPARSMAQLSYSSAILTRFVSARSSSTSKSRIEDPSAQYIRGRCPRMARRGPTPWSLTGNDVT